MTQYMQRALDAVRTGVHMVHEGFTGQVIDWNGHQMKFCRFNAQGVIDPKRGYWLSPEKLEPLVKN